MRDDDIDKRIDEIAQLFAPFWTRFQNNGRLKHEAHEWCEQFGWDPDAADELYRHYESSSSQSSKVLETLERFITLLNNKLMKSSTLLCLSALVLAALGYLFSQRKKQSAGGRQTEPQQSSPRPQAPPPHKVLVLVINAQHERLIQALREGKEGLTTLAEGELYKDTQALWVGSEAELPSSLNTWFSESDVDELSEYDVYLVKLCFTGSSSGFERGESQIDRADAFARLSAEVSDVQVSSRLPSEAYTLHVYER